MNLLTYRSFSTELLKIANDLGDADIRALLSERRGEEYLQGGKLEENKAVPAERVVPAGTSNVKIANFAVAAPGILRAHKKDDSPAYQNLRDTGIKTFGGAAAGAGGAKLLSEMAGKPAVPRTLRVGAAIGAGAALADRAIRHRSEIKNALQPKAKTAFVQQNAAAPFNSPADALSSAQTVGKFQNRVHQSAAQVPGKLGKMPKPHVL